MNRQNFDPENVNNYPLTIDRLAEAQRDWLLPQKMVAGLLPKGGCIVAGCESAGAPGYAVAGVPDGNGGTAYELFEVRGGSSSSVYLVVTERTLTAENSSGATVAVRVERYLAWAVNRPESGTYAAYADLPRLWLRKAPQDDDVWKSCTGGLWWHTPLGGTSLRVQRVGGKVHLWGKVKYGLRLNGAVVFVGNANELATTNNLIRTTASTVPELPEGYYNPNGDTLIPIKYNGAPSIAVIDGEGQMLITQESELGDTLEINTWIEV